MASDSLVPGLEVGKLMGGFSATVTAVFWIVIILAILAVVFAIWWYLSFKFNVVVREVINNKTIIKRDKAKVTKTRQGIIFWKLRGFNVRVPEPPSQAIDVDYKGKKWVEFYKKSDGSFVPISDQFTEEKFIKEFPDFKPFTTEQRALLVHELEEAEKYKKKSISEILIALAPYIAIVLVLVVFMIFFNDVVTPTVQLGDKLVKATEKIDSSLMTINNLIGNSTTLKVEYRPTPPGTG